MRWYARVGLAVGLAGVLLTGPAQAAPAGGVVGTGSPASCAEAGLTAALAGGGRVTFDCGGPATIALTSAQTIAADTTLVGGDVITLTGGLSTRLFNVNSGARLRLEHIVLDRGGSSGSDGGALASAGALELDTVTIQDSRTDSNHSGGAIFSTGPVTIRNSLFDHNAGGSGGALFANFANARVTITNSIFRNNQARNTLTGYGGAIWIGEQAQLTYTDGQLNNNSATSGGAVYLSPGAAVTLTAQTTIELLSNSAVRNGGAIFNEGGRLLVAQASLIGNFTVVTTTAGIGLGGGIASQGPVTVRADRLVGNTGRLGGGLYVSATVPGTLATIDHTQFVSNFAVQGQGGGLFAGDAATVMSITDSAFTGNDADGAGGALYRFDAHLAIARSSFSANVAHQAGAGLTLAASALNPGGAVMVRDTTLNNNSDVPSTTAGAGIRNLAEAQLTNVTFKDNTDGLFTGGAGVTTIANTVLQNTLANCTGVLPIDGAGNFATGDSPCGFSATEHGADAKLGPFTKDPRGLTVYFPPLPGSPLVGGAVAVCTLLDQRGALRRPVGCDTGAVQHDGLLPRLFLALVER